jgi:hypothetical protein
MGGGSPGYLAPTVPSSDRCSAHLVVPSQYSFAALDVALCSSEYHFL